MIKKQGQYHLKKLKEHCFRSQGLRAWQSTTSAFRLQVGLYEIDRRVPAYLFADCIHGSP